MTGDEHYRAAERLLAGITDKEVTFEAAAVVARMAQVRATLALAAATYEAYGMDVGRYGS